jgi:hypothetical protein
MSTPIHGSYSTPYCMDGRKFSGSMMECDTEVHGSEEKVILGTWVYWMARAGVQAFCGIRSRRRSLPSLLQGYGVRTQYGVEGFALLAPVGLSEVRRLLSRDEGLAGSFCEPVSLRCTPAPQILWRWQNCG